MTIPNSVTPSRQAGGMLDSDPLLDALRALTGRPTAEFRDGQRQAIEALVNDRGRVLVVQRTGWGKSAVYFLTTHLLRGEGLGPTLLISPLLAMMRNQIEAVKRRQRRRWELLTSRKTWSRSAGHQLPRPALAFTPIATRCT